MIRNVPASPQLKYKFEVICPNDMRLPKKQWLKFVAKALDLPHSRALRFWRDGRASIEGWEDERIDQAFLAKTLRKQSELNKKIDYQQHIIGELLSGVQHSNRDSSSAIQSNSATV